MRAALIGSVAAVAAVCATAVFGASLAHLTATPALYGAPFQAYFNSSGPGIAAEDSLLTALKRAQAIGRITLVSGPAIAVTHLSARAIAATAVKGPMLLSAAQGRLPAADNEIALGASTMRRIGARIGSLAQVTATSPMAPRIPGSSGSSGWWHSPVTSPPAAWAPGQR